MKKMYKSNTNKMICGVCGGMAEYFDMDATVMRLLWVLISLFAGCGILVYIICAFIFPTQEQVQDEVAANSVDSAETDKSE